MHGLTTAAYGERNAAQKILAAEHEANKKRLQQKHAQERKALIASLLPATLRLTTHPRTQYQREAASSWATTGNATRQDVRAADQALNKRDSS